MVPHIVQPGEHLARIAHQHGFPDPKALWDHPANADLKRRRRDPQVLLPGDVVHIPPREEKTEPRPAGAFHRFQLRGSRLMLRLVLRDFDGLPVPGARAQVTIEGKTTQVESDAEGLIEVPVAPAAEKGRLVVPALGLDVPLWIGHLDPEDSASGIRARLTNLGYLAADALDAAALRTAVEEFQCDHGLPVNGNADDATTRARLLAAHGS